MAWTDNPAWCFYDLVTNTRYGLGHFIPESQVDKWALYRVARYCDELVPDGLGGQAPGLPCAITYAHRFGSLTRAYELVGFHTSRDQGFIEINRRLRQLHPEIVRRTEETIAELGGSVRRDGKTDLLTLNDELVISLVLARCHPHEH